MIEFQVVTPVDLLKTTLFSRCRLSVAGCWEWTGSKRAGYGLFWYESKTQGAHRVSYIAFKGDIPADKVVRHSCDNPSCINPNHLSLGTVKENMADREARGRRDVKGEQIGTSKLTATAALAIKKSREPLDVLADRYGVDRSNVWAIRAGKSWKHLNLAVGL